MALVLAVRNTASLVRWKFSVPACQTIRRKAPQRRPPPAFGGGGDAEQDDASTPASQQQHGTRGITEVVQHAQDREPFGVELLR